jgi:anaerobic ribonucleoside-triphosphate reductase
LNNLKIPAEVYSRISGYYRPVYTNGKQGQWNPGKTQEFKERKLLKLPEIKNEVSSDKM